MAAQYVSSTYSLRTPDQDYVWRQWYDLVSSTTITTNGTATFRTTDEELWRNYYTGTPITWTQVNPVQARVWDRWEVTVRETEEQARARELVEQHHQEYRDREQRRREEINQLRLAEAERIAGAQERALELLEMLLTPEEAEHRDRHGELLVRGSEGGMFVIEERDSVHGNVREIDEHGCILGRICVAPQMYHREPGQPTLSLPLADGWVGQYLAIKYQEERFRETGNWSGRRPCQHPGVPILRTAA
jgi:hypothetical protein